jgi:hypothetical protein
VDITSSITSAYSYVSIPTQTLANPSTGFRITTDGDSIAVDYVQNQNGAFITSAIPTTTASVTRAADVITLATASIPGFSASTLTMYLEVFQVANPGAVGHLANLGDGSADERISIRREGNSNRAFGVVTGGVTQVSLFSGTIDVGLNKLAIAVAANDVAATAEGATPGTDTSATLPTLTTLAIGSRGATLFANAHISKLRLYSTRKTNAQLQAMTQ